MPMMKLVKKVCSTITYANQIFQSQLYRRNVIIYMDLALIFLNRIEKNKPQIISART